MIKININKLKIKLLQGTYAFSSPIISISAQLKFNINVVIKYLCQLPVLKRDITSPPLFIIVGSFDVNHPRKRITEFKRWNSMRNITKRSP